MVAMGNGASRALKIAALLGALSRKGKRLKSTAISLCLCRIIQTILKYSVKLQAGDLLIIDNRKTAHARSQFTARFDGSDRWIQRAFAISNHRYYTEKLGKKVRVFDLVAEL